MNATSSGASRPARVRASDAQRTSVWQALDTAFSEGQLDHFEHLERTRAVHRTRFVDELWPLVADLQGVEVDLPGHGPGPGHGSHSAHGSGAAHGTGADRDPDGAGADGGRRGRRRALTFGVLVALAIGIGVAVAVSSSDGTGGSGFSSSESAEPGPLHTETGLTRMLDAARQEFGEDPIDSLIVHGDRATLMREDPTEPGKRLAHQFSGGAWQEPTFSSRTDSATFTLGGLDAREILAMIDAAPEEVDESGAPVSHVSVYGDVLGEPEYRVNVKLGERLGTVSYRSDGTVERVEKP